MDLKVNIGKRIKELRTLKNLTQEALAWESDVDRTFMNHVENGKRNISVDSLEKIILGLGTNPRDFFTSDFFSNNPTIIRFPKDTKDL
jgi:transcriptional regulator with XRE-family HTH domain